MLEVSIPKDIRKYETKVVGPFTVRQTFGLVIGLGLGFIGNRLANSLVSDAKVFLTMLFGVPGVLIGWIKMYGMPFEQYVKVMITNSFLIPRKIKYKTNVFCGEISKIEKEIELLEHKEKKTKKAKPFKNPTKNPDYVRYS